jgi:beta-xylosidase
MPKGFNGIIKYSSTAFLTSMLSGPIYLNAQILHPRESVCNADKGDGTCRNPLLHADYSDPDFGIYMFKTSDPRGSWSEPHLLCPVKGWIDPYPLWDEDGNA